MKVIVTSEADSNCCKLCVAPCTQEGVCPCDVFLDEHRDDVRVRNCGCVYFVPGGGIEYVGFDNTEGDDECIKPDDVVKCKRSRQLTYNEYIDEYKYCSEFLGIKSKTPTMEEYQEYLKHEES